eukprot:CAMPEP_0185191482 /NCGR_PEP_ID=MMETSP1140-20130426/15518_1 /TAXON_ID=298111 /ORGANISM="Pavlova sp., Strain CCMP459" /LENGTH=251 /DNA_ID=CAMNT_0027758187 /DNA_START=32 /DNA_END=787 /DNA_ORIENTATION=-
MALARLLSRAPAGLAARPRLPLVGFARGLFIQTENTPNPESLKFLPGKPVLDTGTAEFKSFREAQVSPLAKRLFQIDGIKSVFFAQDFITITKAEETPWSMVKPHVFSHIMDFYAEGGKVLNDANEGISDTQITDDDSEVVAMIKELIETRVRPSVQEDGGDIVFKSFDEETGVVLLKLQGSCSGCPSSSITLKSGIENMMMHYIPEVTAVEAIDEDEDEDDLEILSPPTGGKARQASNEAREALKSLGDQ